MPKRILIIDDEPGILTALTIRLQASGFDISAERDGQSGLRAAKEILPHVILLDIRLPDMPGFDVCRRLKAIPQLAHVPIIFLTANVKDVARHQAEEVGGAAFLSKPFEASDVLAAIDSVIQDERVSTSD